MGAYPEHDKMAAVREQSQAIGEFLDWLDEQRISLCRIEKPEGYREMWFPIHDGTNPLLARYFGIDLNVIETEKRAMLAALREPPR